MNKLSHGFILTVLLSLFSACAIEPDESGNCPLNCNKAAPIGNFFDNEGKQTIEITLLTETPYWCSLDSSSGALDATAASQPIRVQFRFMRRVKGYPFKGKAEEEEKFRLAEPAKVDTVVPVAGVSFTPIVSGTLSAAHTDATVASYDSATGSTDPAHLAGIVTPRDEWCSDACGIATLEVWPKCQDDSIVSISINSGGLAPDDSQRFSWSNADEASLHHLGIQSVRKYAYGTLPKTIPSFLQAPSLELSPPNEFGEKPWLEHDRINDKSIQAAAQPQFSKGVNIEAVSKTWN